MLVHQRTFQDLLCHTRRMTWPTLMSTSREKVRGRLSPVLGTQDIPKNAAPLCHAGPASQGTQHHVNTHLGPSHHPGQGSRQPPRPHTRDRDSRNGGCLSLLRDEPSPSPRAQEKHLKQKKNFLRTLCRDCVDRRRIKSLLSVNLSETPFSHKQTPWEGGLTSLVLPCPGTRGA